MCDSSKIRELKAKIQELEKENVKLRKENEELRKQLFSLGSKVEKHQSIIERTFKPNRKKRQKKPGAKPGHKAYHRPKPKKIDEVIEVNICPHCGTRVKGGEIRSRIIEEIKPAKPIVKQYNIHKRWCSKCKRVVYPKPLDVIPNMHFGLSLGLLVTFQSYALSLTLQ